MWMSCSRSQGPKMPCRPKSSSRKSPTTTGETVNGRSIRDVRKARPGNRKRAIDQAAASPKITFRPTATGATMSVSSIEWKVSGSSNRLARYTRGPAANASTKTFTRGTSTSKPMIATATVMSVTRTQRGSSCARMAGGEVVSAMVTGAPTFDEVDAEQGDEGHDEEHDRDRGRLPVGELFQPGHHQDGGDLGLEGHVARDEHHRPVLAERAREGEREAGDDRRQDRRQGHLHDGLQAVRAQAGRRLLDVTLEALQHRL